VSIPSSARLVLVEGGTPLARSLISERARLELGAVAVIIDDDLDDAAATTLLLSGRADAVARRETARVSV
jgi:anthraniloyl-CoA monooxygenase